MKKTLAFATGHLEKASFLRLQLSLESVFDLRFGGTPYRDILLETLKLFETDIDCFLGEQLAPPTTIAELKQHLNAAIPTWRRYRTVLSIPGTLYLEGLQDLENVIAKACHSDFPFQTKTTPPAYCVPVGMLDQPELQDRPLSDLPDSLLIPLGETHHNLSESQGVFQALNPHKSSRHFNSFQIKGPYIFKTSKKASKAKAEWHFLTTLPSTVRPYFPTVGTCTADSGYDSYEIERIPLFDSSRILIHARVNPNIFHSLLSLIDEYRTSCPVQTVSREYYSEHVNQLFVHKMFQRMAEFHRLPSSAQVTRYAHLAFPGGLEALTSTIAESIRKHLPRVETPELIFSHGDLCLSNILYDHLNRSIKLIDPRGSLTENDAYLPWYYDLAKLSHSFLGSYDIIQNDMVTLRVERGLQLEMNHLVPKNFLEGIRKGFLAWVKQHGWNYPLMRACEASLFLSMMPLHSDRPDHMILQMVAASKAIRDAIPLKTSETMSSELEITGT